MDLFPNTTHPFNERKVFISGFDVRTRKQLSQIIKEAGGEKVSQIAKTTHFVISDGTKANHLDKVAKYTEDGYRIRVLGIDEVLNMIENDYDSYRVQKEKNKEWEISYDAIMKRRFHKDAFNPYVGLEIYAGDSEATDVIRQMFGNLGAFANNVVDGCNVCYISQRSMDDLSKGITSPTMRLIEDYYNKAKAQQLSIDFILEPDFILFVKEWVNKTGDDINKEMLEKYERRC